MSGAALTRSVSLPLAPQRAVGGEHVRRRDLVLDGGHARCGERLQRAGHRLLACPSPWAAGPCSRTRSPAASSRMPVGSPFGAAVDAAARRVRRGRGDAGDLQRLAVDERRVPVAGGDDDRTRVSSARRASAFVASVPAGSIACRYQFTTCRNSPAPRRRRRRGTSGSRAWNCATVSAAYSRLQVTQLLAAGEHVDVGVAEARASRSARAGPGRVVRFPMNRRTPRLPPA